MALILIDWAGLSLSFRCFPQYNLAFLKVLICKQDNGLIFNSGVDNWDLKDIMLDLMSEMDEAEVFVRETHRMALLKIHVHMLISLKCRNRPLQVYQSCSTLSTNLGRNWQCFTTFSEDKMDSFQSMSVSYFIPFADPYVDVLNRNEGLGPNHLFKKNRSWSGIKFMIFQLKP